MAKFKVALFGLLLGAGLAVSGPASAASYLFNFTGVNYTATGQFTTSNTVNGDGTYDILSASGILTSVGPFLSGALSFTGPGPGSAGNEIWDNKYDPSGNLFAYNGIGLEVGASFVTIYNSVSSGYLLCSTTCLSSGTDPGPLFNPGDEGTLAITAVPEPAIWAMLLIGFGFIGSLIRLGRRQAPSFA